MPGVVAICGAGNLGRRHLEGTLHSGQVDAVHVYDIIEGAFAACEQVVGDFGAGGAEVFLHRSLADLPTRLDLVIVATTADVRPRVVAQLATHSQVRRWILEKVLAQDEGGLEKLVEATSNSLVWVNTSRRMIEWHRRLRDLIRGNGSISMLVSGGDWGLACNAVHFMDLLTWWSDEVPQRTDTSNLESAWGTSKREGFREVFGSMSITYSAGSRLTLVARHGPEPIVIEVEVGGLTWVIDESEGVARRSDGIEQFGSLELQSEVTPRLIDSVLGSDNCALPTLEESVETHRVLLRALTAHWVLSGGRGDGVPIT